MEGTTGNDGISSISCIPLCCCANTACPVGLGRIGEVSLFIHNPPGSPWGRAEHSDIWHIGPPWGEKQPKSVCLVLLHSFLLFTLSCLCPSGINAHWDFQKMTGPLKITRTACSSVSDKASNRVAWQHTGGQFSACSVCFIMGQDFWVFVCFDLHLSPFVKPLYFVSLQV